MPCAVNFSVRELSQMHKLQTFTLSFTISIFCISFAQDYTKYYGGWYDEAYIETLLETKSIADAMKSSKSPLLLIFKSKSGVEQTNYSNFHEAGGDIIYPLSEHEFGVYKPSGLKNIKSTELDIDRFILPKNTDGPLRWYSSPGQYTTYIKISSFGSMLHYTLLDGEYVDSNGNKYTFDQGSASWPSRQFHYEIKLDLAFIGSDCFVDVDNDSMEFPTNLIGFQKNDSSLELFKLRLEPKYKMEAEREDKPFVILTQLVPLHYYKSTRFSRLELRSDEELRYLRNEIFARHGQSFNNQEFRLFFHNKV